MRGRWRRKGNGGVFNGRIGWIERKEKREGESEKGEGGKINIMD